MAGTLSLSGQDPRISIPPESLGGFVLSNVDSYNKYLISVAGNLFFKRFDAYERLDRRFSVFNVPLRENTFRGYASSWSDILDSNQAPHAYQACALTN